MLMIKVTSFQKVGNLHDDIDIAIDKCNRTEPF